MHVKKMLDVDHAGAEAALAIGQIQLPHTLEPGIETTGGKLRPGLLETLPPFGKRSRIVLTEAGLVNKLQAGVGDRLFQLRHRWQHAARKNVTLDEIRFAPIFLKRLILDRDGLKGRPPARFQK